MKDLDREHISRFIVKQVAGIGLRNGRQSHLNDLDAPLLSVEVGINSLDLAEIVLALETEYGVSPFEGTERIETWIDVIDIVLKRSTEGRSQ